MVDIIPRETQGVPVNLRPVTDGSPKSRTREYKRMRRASLEDRFPEEEGVSDLYDTDFLEWSEEQARALRAAGHAGANLPIDWENVAEEIEALGKALARELASRVAVILVHLIKLQASPATMPRAGWRATVRLQRAQIQRLLKQAPSLRPTVAGVVEQELPDARAEAAASLADNGENPLIELGSITSSEDQVLGAWLPDTSE